MSDPSPVTSQADSRGPGSTFLGLLRALALIAILAGAAESARLMFAAGQDTPRLLLVLFTVWVLSPFVALLWATLVSTRWPVATRVALYSVTFVVTLGSVAIYSGLVDVKPAGAANAFLFVAVPPVSWALMVIVLALAAFISRRQSRRGPAD